MNVTPELIITWITIATSLVSVGWQLALIHSRSKHNEGDIKKLQEAQHKVIDKLEGRVEEMAAQVTSVLTTVARMEERLTLLQGHG